MNIYIKGLLLTSIGFLFLASHPSQAQKSEAINWLTIEEAYKKIQTEPRKVLIDIYTDWCGWCKVMDRETFRNPDVVQYINKNYYAVKLNAEQKEAIVLGNTEFSYDAANRTHQLALSLTNNRPSYPTTVFLDDQFQMIQPLPGYMKAREFHEVITFFGEGYHKKEAFETYQKTTYRKIIGK
ncbi:thioredoxin family protein [Dyadobacter tibetensis]|uniref:thioredoxin family protein n=1 Tax=Dyadobacter tibetensis TaxID=1211851 RepID=UPI000472C56A|nr:DUF255 domain-containing protein [Dyadobacter tibetensis]